MARLTSYEHVLCWIAATGHLTVLNDSNRTLAVVVGMSFSDVEHTSVMSLRVAVVACCLPLCILAASDGIDTCPRGCLEPT